MELETCRCNLELLCPIVAFLWDRTNLAIGVGYAPFLILFWSFLLCPYVYVYGETLIGVTSMYISVTWRPW